MPDSDEGFRCEVCGAIATWRGEWSDRRMYVCTKHRDDVRRAHDGDHSYDQTGISWDKADGSYEYEDTAAIKSALASAPRSVLAGDPFDDPNMPPIDNLPEG